jgi:hypothetical protein
MSEGEALGKKRCEDGYAGFRASVAYLPPLQAVIDLVGFKN